MTTAWLLISSHRGVIRDLIVCHNQRQIADETHAAQLLGRHVDVRPISATAAQAIRTGAAA